MSSPIGVVPSLSLAAAEAIVAEHFGLFARASALPSERDQNILVHAEDGRRFVLKIANASERRAVLEGECDVLRELANTGLCPTVVRTRSGDELTQIEGHWVRLITALDGAPLATVPLHTDALRRDVGRAVGQLDLALASFDHPSLHRTFQWDLAHAQEVVHTHQHLVRDTMLRDCITRVSTHHREAIVPLLPSLRRSVIHGDPNDYNVLVDHARQHVTGIVDFGDMVASHTVNDVAIAMAYVALGSDDPLQAAAQVAAGYHAVFPLREDEISALFGLMCMRLCVSACLAARQQADRPDIAYLGISQAPIQRTLPTLAAVHPRLAHYILRDACGLEPVPHAARVVSWLRANGSGFAPLLGCDLRSTPVAPLDFSAGSALIANDPAHNAPRELDDRIARVLAEHGALIGVGGYDEARLIYHWPNEPQGTERRTIHLGLDLSTQPGTPLYAPLDGVVHGFENADFYHDYGPVIVLRHETTHEPPVAFFTLYGHLSVDSLDGLTIGQRIAKGTEFARIGESPTNGHWWAHVHMQVMVDMLDVPCNVNGAARASQRRVWKSICPDPNLLLGIPPERFARHDARAAISTARASLVGRNVRVSYGADALNIVRGDRQYLYNADGHRFLDAYNNVAHVGHAHPRVVRAVSEQLSVLNTNTRYLQEQLTRYAEALLATFPDPLRVCFFTASGSEANELALRLARTYTGARDLIVMDHAYHGHTTTLIDISPYKHNGPGGTGAPDWVHSSPIPDVYRDRRFEGSPGAWFASEVGRVVERVRQSGRGLSGYIAETCPSVGGQIMPPDGFLREVYARVRDAGGVCIADEVQTGFGRIGSHFWAFEAQAVVPDIVVLGKPMANGYPMGAVITTREIADRFDNGMEFFSTFGGSTAACVAAHATLEVTLEEGLQDHALQVGTSLRAALSALAADHELVGDVRGSGLFLGVELVRDRETRAPAASEAGFVVSRMRARGVLAGTDGPHHNVIKLRGPMCLSLADAERVAGVLEQSLREVPPTAE